MIVKISLELQYDPENLELNKVWFAKKLDIPSTHEELWFKAAEYFNL